MNANILVETDGLSRYEWLRYRKQGIGGSDVAAILGISKWNSAISLWLNKTNQTEDDTQENEAMEWGTIMESVIRNHFAKVTGKTVVEVHAMLQHPDYPFMMLCSYFNMKQYETITATDGMEALNKIKMKPDIILLDINMPRMDGIEVCRLIRSKVLCPILFLTARVDEDDKINGLLSGGDDYITKPFSLRELEARIVTNIKREERHQQKTEYRFMDEMLIDYSEKIVAIAGHRMEFTKIEYQIIEFLSMHPGQVFDKERIYAQVCGYDAEGDSRTITELVRRIRKKIADYSEKEYIETVWGIGYRWKK